MNNMNKMNNMNNKEISSFMLQDQFSQASILVMPPKSDIQIQYERTFRELSQLRSENRQIKQQNIWLKKNKSGLSEQCQTLKQLLRNNKEISYQLNNDIRVANQQINRLEDQLFINEDQLQAKQQKLKQNNDKYQKYWHQTHQQINQLKQQLNSKNMKIVYLERQLQESKEKKMVKEQPLQLHNKILEVISRLNLQANDGSSTNVQFSHEKSPKNITKNITKHITKKQPTQILIQRLENCVENIQKQHQQHIYYKEQHRKLSQFHQISTRKYQIVQSQLQQASDLLEQSRKQNKQLITKTLQLQQQKQQLQTKKQQDQNKIKHISATFIKKQQERIRKIFNILGQLIPGEHQLLNKLLIKINQQNSQLDQILINQLQNVVSQQYSKYIMSEHRVEQIKKIQRKYRNLQEQNQMLSIKHTTLQRQFDGIIQDNRRILKYNTLSRYRTERNNNRDSPLNKKIMGKENTDRINMVTPGTSFSKYGQYHN